MYQHLSLQDTPKSTQIGIFGLKIYYLATQVLRLRLSPRSIGAYGSWDRIPIKFQFRQYCEMEHVFSFCSSSLSFSLSFSFSIFFFYFFFFFFFFYIFCGPPNVPRCRGSLGKARPLRQAPDRLSDGTSDYFHSFFVFRRKSWRSWALPSWPTCTTTPSNRYPPTKAHSKGNEELIRFVSEFFQQKFFHDKKLPDTNLIYFCCSCINFLTSHVCSVVNRDCTIGSLILGVGRYIHT
jgi:hypothetical protein